MVIGSRGRKENENQEGRSRQQATPGYSLLARPTGLLTVVSTLLGGYSKGKYIVLWCYGFSGPMRSAPPPGRGARDGAYS